MIKAGTVVGGRYQVWDRLGRGGMGTVYNAHHMSLDRAVAIKFLHPEYARDEAHVARFIREAKVSSRLGHEHAITIFDFGEHDGQLFLVMELLTGKPLHRIIGRGRALEIDRANTMAWQIADCLVAAHDLSLVHRDLKPENIMIEEKPDGSDRAVVVDFGLAFLAETDQQSMARMTREGIVAGTPAFISPEQAQGRELGPPSDVYSFGCVLYEMYTGYTVFLGIEAIDLLNKHIFVPPTPPREAYPDANVPVAIDALIMNMLSKDAADRPTALEVRDWLTKVLGNENPRDRGRPEELLSPRRDRSVTHSPGSETMRMTPQKAMPKAVPSGATIAVISDDVPPEWIISLATAGFNTHATVVADVMHKVAITYPSTPADVETLSKKCSVVAVTDDASIEALTELMKAGAFDVIATPFELKDLVKKVERAWRKRS